MDEKKYLTEQIKKCRRKMNTAKLIDCGILFAALGGIPGMLCELASLVWPFYYAHLAAGCCFAAGLLAGTGYGLYRRADMRQAAGRLDSFGLKERMITACEQINQEHELALLQRQDAVVHYDRIRGQIKIPLWPDKRHIMALALSLAVVAGLALVPSPVRDRAQLRHQVQEQAKEELSELHELQDALEGVDMDSLTDEQRAQLQELLDAMELSREELAKADSWESLASAMEKLDYKYGQAAGSLASLAGQLDNPEGAGIAAAEALAKALANQGGRQLAGSGTPGTGSGGDGTGDGDGSDGGQGSGSGGQDGSGGGQQGAGSGNGNGDGSGSGNGNGNGNGNGDGSGGGTGGGNGSGSGGNGRGTGSSSAAHDYVSIPNAIADDPSLTGNQGGNQDSDYFRQQNGLAWEGSHVDYSSVLGEYTDSAYEGIANGRYPNGMTTVIRDYFENLNK